VSPLVSLSIQGRESDDEEADTRERWEPIKLLKVTVEEIGGLDMKKCT